MASLLLASPVRAGAAGASPTAPAAPAAPGLDTGWSIAPASGAIGPHNAPAVFQFDGKDGAAFTSQFVVANRTTNAITFNLYSADAYNTRIGGAWALKPSNVRQIDVGNWITLPTDKITLPARTEANVTYTMRIPKNAYPGDHAGGIVAQDATPSMLNKGAVRIPVLEGEGVRVYVRVNGPLHPSIAVQNPVITYSYPALAWATGTGKGAVAFQVADTGNTRLDVVAHVKAENLFGSTIKTYPDIKVPALIPGYAATLTEPAIGLPHLGLVRFNISLQANGAAASGSTTAWLIPWYLALIVALVILAVGVWWLRRRRRKVPPPPDDRTSTPKKPSPTPAAVG
jgi:hypothetical protein